MCKEYIYIYIFFNIYLNVVRPTFFNIYILHFLHSPIISEIGVKVGPKAPAPTELQFSKKKFH